MRDDIKSMTPEELRGVFTGMGQPAFRAGQVFRWLSDGVRSFDEMTNLPAALRGTLNERFYITAPEMAKKQASERDGTVKYLWRLGDGNLVESVVMPYKHGNTVCISTQVGCRMGCAFCASTLGGLARNLAPSEMLDQVMYSQEDSGNRISNIVLMGIGEPLDNFCNVVRFLELVNHGDGLNIGMRHISLSTCGIAEMIDKLGDYKLQLTLSVSLHAPDDETRTRLMPVNRSGGVGELLSACDRYFKKTGRRVSFEYALISGVNDSPYYAELLAEKLKASGSHLNLILLNDVRERKLRASAPERVREFAGILKREGVNYTFRRKLGGDIDASCGQLRAKLSKAEAAPRGQEGD